MVKVYQMYKDIWNTTVNHEASFKIVASGGTFPEGSLTLDRVLDPNKHVQPTKFPTIQHIAQTVDPPL